MVRVLELFSGTGSVGKCCDKLGWDKVSVDLLLPADHECDIMDFDYKQYPKDHFDIVWASPPCTEYSQAKTQGIRDIEGANKIVLKTLEIIKYFDCEFWFLENPQTAKLKDQEFMKSLPYVDCDYCMYGKPYRKRTRIWTNKKDIKLKLCDKNCGSFVDGRHIGSCGCGGQGQGHKKSYSNKSYSLHEKYSIPEDLIFSLLLE
jgi:site-specific DNA-cytosine methylase